MYLQLAQQRIIETKRLILRPITLDDADALFEYASDAENTRYTFPTHQSIEETRWLIANLFMKSPLGHFAIELKDHHKMIGTCDIRPDSDHQSVELAYALNKKFWGQGIATEAASTLLNFSENKLSAKRIWAAHDVRTPASGKIMSKIGMTQEGILRNRKNLCNELTDQAIYSYIPSD